MLRLPGPPPGGSGQLADLVPDRLGVPAEDDVLDRVRVSGGHVAEPQRDRREILEQDLLRLLAEAERLLVLRRGQRLAQGQIGRASCRERGWAAVVGAAGGMDAGRRVQAEAR